HGHRLAEIGSLRRELGREPFGGGLAPQRHREALGVVMGVAARLAQAAATGGTSCRPPAAGRSSKVPPALVRRPASSWRHARPSNPGRQLTRPHANSTRSGVQERLLGNGGPTWPFTGKHTRSRCGSRQKKDPVFKMVSARPSTTIGDGLTKPLRLLT